MAVNKIPATDPDLDENIISSCSHHMSGLTDQPESSYPERANVCVIVPAFRESSRIGPFLSSLMESIAIQPECILVTIVDDGSGIAEAKRLREVLAPLFQTHFKRLRLVELNRNRGKGGAILAGWSGCPPCEYLGFVDADGSIQASEVIRLIREALARKDERIAFFASRVKMLGRTVERSWFRHLAGRVFASFVALATGIPVYDSQCGCKFISYSVYRKIRPILVEKRFAFDVELMLAILRSGHAVEEKPIHWRNIAGSKVSFFRDTLNMIFACMVIRRRASRWTF